MRRKLSQSATRPLQGTVSDRGSNRAPNRARSSGFTLMEVVIASTLLLLAIIPIVKALTICEVTARTIEHRTVGLLLAQSRLDRIRTLSIYNYASSFAESSASLDGAYLCNVTDTSAGANLRTIVVSVGYDLDGDNVLDTDEIEVALTSYVAKRW